MDDDICRYLPVLGLDAFCKAATGLLLGNDNKAIQEGRAIGVQCLSGTGSLRMGAEFLSRVMGLKTVYLSNPTWYVLEIYLEIFRIIDSHTCLCYLEYLLYHTVHTCK